jgi:hypothetical protein
MNKRLLLVLAIILVAAVMLACGMGELNCYSTFPGCEETAQVVIEITAAVATATAVAQ